jgi:hypothetical protein
VTWGYAAGSESVEYATSSQTSVAGVYSERNDGLQAVSCTDALLAITLGRANALDQHRCVNYATQCTGTEGICEEVHHASTTDPLVHAVLLWNFRLRDIPPAEHPVGRAGQSSIGIARARTFVHSAHGITASESAA